MAANYSVHPSIGIARLGSSPEFFIGPEIPEVALTTADGKFRDAAGRLRRQAARFRVFATDSATGTAKEVTVGATIDGKKVEAIEWTAHLANKKAFWFEFDGPTGEGQNSYPNGHPLRNGTLAEPLATRRQKYVIDFGERTLTGAGQSARFSKGTGGGFAEVFPGPINNGAADVEIVELGEMFTDADGRLTVVGGFGISGHRGGVPVGKLDFANNPQWFDDTSDGPVTARIRFENTPSLIETTPSWVIVAPPDFAPEVENLVTMYDLLFDMAVRKFGFAPGLFDMASGHFSTAYTPSYLKEIYPILKRAGNYRWVIKTGAMRHIWDYAALAAKPYAAVPGKPGPTKILAKLRKPAGWHNAFDDDGFMPQLYGDTGENTSSLTLTPTQYHLMSQWRDGTFESNWNPSPSVPTEITPKGLDRAALDHCIGGAFFPGIEAGWILRDPRVFAGPFRLKAAISDEFDFTGLTPGSVTMRSALPWQADFLDCATHWWPAARPNQVHVDKMGTVKEWARDSAGHPMTPGADHLAMVQNWHQLKMILPATNAAGAAILAEETP